MIRGTVARLGRNCQLPVLDLDPQSAANLLQWPPGVSSNPQKKGPLAIRSRIVPVAIR